MNIDPLKIPFLSWAVQKAIEETVKQYLPTTISIPAELTEDRFESSNK